MEAVQYITTFFKDFVFILSEMAPYLLLGFLFAGVLHAFIPQRNIERYFNGNPFWASVYASLFGVPLPLCSCGVIPAGAALYKNGASRGGTVSFLISTPQTGVDSILATFSLMGLPFAVVRAIAALVTGITGGLVTAVITNGEKEERILYKEAGTKKNFSQKAIDVFRYGFVEFIQDISKWLVIGLVLAAAISVLIPDEYIVMLALSPVLQMLMILVVSVPLYICATGSIPLAAVLILKGISPGAAFVLLMAGPATNAATITMIGKVIGKKSLFAYLATIMAGAIGFGLLIDYVLPSAWFVEITQNHLGHNHDSMPGWWQIASGAVLAALIINGYIQRYFNSKKRGEIQLDNTMDIKIIKVEGMSCNRCKANVENNLEKLSFINNVMVDLAEKSVTIEGDNIKIEEVKEVVNRLGYEVV